MERKCPNMIIVLGVEASLIDSRDNKIIILASLLTVFIVVSVSLAIFSLNVIISESQGSKGTDVPRNALKPEGTNKTIIQTEELVQENQLYLQRAYQLEKLMMIRMGRGEGKYKIAFLTFDDGPSSNTEKVLDILNRYGIKATFFVIGNDTDYGRSMYQRIVTEGHAIGNHTYTHEYGDIYKSANHFWNDFYRMEELIYSATGTRPGLLRFPGGSNNQVSRHAGGRNIMGTITRDISSRGYFYADWDIESGDASRFFRSSDYLYKRVIGNLEYYDSAVILFHDTRRNTPLVDALPKIIEKMISEGYVFLPITEAYYPLMPQFQ